jgi:hypothetical protein
MGSSVDPANANKARHTASNERGTAGRDSCPKQEENSTMKKTRINPSKTPASITSLSPSHDAIAARAAAIWEQNGRPEGRDQEHWLRAERELARPRADFDKESGNEELDALFPSQSGSATTSL